MTACIEASRATLKLMSGGSRATLVNDPIVIPRPGASMPGAVTTTTGEGTRRITARNVDPSTDSEGIVAIAEKVIEEG